MVSARVVSSPTRSAARTTTVFAPSLNGTAQENAVSCNIAGSPAHVTATTPDASDTTPRIVALAVPVPSVAPSMGLNVDTTGAVRSTFNDTDAVVMLPGSSRP